MKGKAKEQFEEWYNENYEFVEMPSIDDSFCINTFYELPEAMQWGVYQDFADSIGVRITIAVFYDQMLKYTRGYELRVNDELVFDSGDVFETRQEARNAAIEKLNELINQNK
jgi:hypothetical protein